MTVVHPNHIVGINSITVQTGDSLSVHKSDGSLIRTIVSNTGVSTFHSIEVGSAATVKNNGNATFSGIVTASSFKLTDGSNVGGTDSDAQGNTVGGTNSGDSFSGTSAIKNTLFGYNSGTAITSGDQNTAFGYDALKTVATTESNTAVGFEALKVADGDLGTAVGKGALANDTGDGYNAALGASAGGQVTSGTNNSFLGYTAGSNLETGDYNIILGAWARSSATGVDRECTIGGESSTRVANRFRIPGIGLTITGNTSNPYPSSGSQLYLPGGADFVGVVTASAFHGDGSALSGVSVGVATSAHTATNAVVTLDLSKQDHKLTLSGICTVDCKGGTEGDAHTVRIINSGIATVGFSTYFLFPSGAAPVLPSTNTAINQISFTVHHVGAGATQLLAGASLNYG